MSKATGPFSSRTLFQALEVDSGEESEEIEEVPVQPETPQSETSTTNEPAKLSKTALKKAAKAARLEKQQKRNAKLGLAENSPIVSSSEASPAGSIANPVKVLPDEESIVVEPPPAAVSEPPVEPATQVPDPVVEPALVPAPKVAPQQPEPEKLPEVFTPAPYIAPQPVAEPYYPPATLPIGIDAERAQKRQNILTRTLASLIMIGGFLGLLALGHAYMILLVILCQTLVYREVTALFSLKNAAAESMDDVAVKKGKDPWSKTLNWYFFAVTNYFLYGESIIYYFKHVVFTDAQLMIFATNHRIISFTLYIIGFMGFVMSLKKGYLKQQFGLFCWVHMSLLLIVVSSHFIVNNILEGLIWFWVPASLVICNDVFAYIWGITVGRTPLIKLSPKKTVEGFVGAFGSTVIFSIFWGTYFASFNYMICPVHDLGVSAWDDVQCAPNQIFVWRDYKIWAPIAIPISSVLGRQITTIPYMPYQLHLLCMSTFASLVAPFGGFFASGFKRAFNIKDFGHSIPGHGGMTDRMDCQFLMGVFTYVYYSSLVRTTNVTVGSALQMIVSGLSTADQLLVIADLKRYLEGQGIKVPC
ncbi:cytidylyltransferase family-domain-containing protein [Mycena floridula]|nr:cytidylyltransferase family-domain-containing protein [Mycena floridula]